MREEPATSPAVSGSPPLVWLVERLMLPLLGLEHELRIQSTARESEER